MGHPTYKVIQWATGNVGIIGVRHFIENPTFELAGVLVTNPEKVGKDAGELAGLPPCGVMMTDDVEAIFATEADCVHFAPSVADIPMVCRLLRSGKNVVSPLGPFYPTDRYRADWEAIEAACKDGGTSFHGSGIHPGFSGDLLPLTLIRIMERVDHIAVYEVVDHLANPSRWLEFMGFGHDCDALLAKPTRGPEAPHQFATSMALVAEALGKTVENLTTKFEVAGATRDIAYPGGVINAGTVAGQHYEWTAWADGAPLITYHSYWSMGKEHVQPRWDVGEPGYRIVMEGNPPMDVTIRRPPPLEHGARYISMWTAMAGINAISAVCEAKPGMLTHRDLGVPAMHGLVRRQPAQRG